MCSLQYSYYTITYYNQTFQLKNKLPTADYATFKTAIGSYVQRRDFQEFLGYLDTIFTEKPALRYLIQGMESYVFPEDKEQFSSYWERMKC